MKKEHIFLNIPDKHQNRHTTTHKLKEDLLDFFSEDHWSSKNCLEVGTAFGHTTRVLSFIFNKVYTIEAVGNNIEKAKELNFDRANIEYVLADAYQLDWKLFTGIDVVFIDCKHEIGYVKQDIERSLEIGNKDFYLVFDDYGHTNQGVNFAVNDFIDDGKIEFVKHIGQSAGTQVHAGLKIRDWEGVICKRVIE